MALSHGVIVRTVLVSVSEGPRRVSCTERSAGNQNMCYLLGLANTKMLFHGVQ